MLTPSERSIKKKRKASTARPQGARTRVIPEGSVLHGHTAELSPLDLIQSVIETIELFCAAK